MENSKTKELLDKYYDGVAKKSDWSSLISDNFLLTGTIAKETRGRDAYVNNNFFKGVKSLKIKEMIVKGDKASAVVHYDMVSPKGNSFTSDVAEIWNVKNGKLDSVAIYFDTAAFQKAMA